MSTETQVPDGFMEDSKGAFWPIDKVKDTDKLQDQTVRKILGFADELNAQIARFKGHTFSDVAAFQDILRDKYGVEKGGKKGNVTLTSFDGKMKVVVAVQDYIDFGSELQIAKELIEECIEEWSEGSRDEIRALVNHAFNVDKPGQVNRAALFQLRRIEIDHDKWRAAIDAINDSIKTEGSKTYFRFYRRDTPEGKWKSITIDLASAVLKLDPKKGESDG
ncbi:DUF3164 family protein [Terasakiella sp. A23]|uniref:DUF3164 family protein n=1 Tax=Terasakiella sp. FCG-A23 TaxID=3080561 RepID=UPI0029531B2F|nr:DUF3164 family protein [Terasakiella sp. A23]MDV7341002.1 DUF3164 family protein [Terasakiella sp. A23]